VNVPIEYNPEPFYWIVLGLVLIICALCAVAVMGQKELNKPKPRSKTGLRFGNVDRRKNGY